MGLDMYLTRVVDVPHKTTTTVDFQVGYWRKANAIHNWFVENVQDGVDECQEVHVPWEKLQELKALCRRVLDTKNPIGLEPTPGFFFGSTEVDEYYFQDIDDTLDILDKLDEEETYYYQASW